MLINCLLRFIVSSRFRFSLIWHLCQPKHCTKTWHFSALIWIFNISVNIQNFFPATTNIENVGTANANRVILGVSYINHDKIQFIFRPHTVWKRRCAHNTKWIAFVDPRGPFPYALYSWMIRTSCTKQRYVHHFFRNTSIFAFIQVVLHKMLQKKNKW